MLQRKVGLETKQNINVGKSGISIEQADFVAPGGQRNGKVYRYGCFADTTFTTGDGDNAGSFTACWFAGEFLGWCVDDGFRFVGLMLSRPEAESFFSDH